MLRFNNFVSFFASFFLLAIVLTPMAFAGGGSIIGNGGGSAACFHGSAENSVQNGILTSYGASTIVSAVSLEYFVSHAEKDIDPRLEELISDDDESGVNQFLSRRLQVAPNFEWTLRTTSMIVFPLGLEEIFNMDFQDTQDWSIPVNFPSNCARVQTIVRFGNFVNIEAKIWSRLSLSQRAVLMLHEQIYYFGEKFAGMTSSRPTQDLLTYLMSRNFTDAGFRAKLVNLHFLSHPLLP